MSLDAENGIQRQQIKAAKTSPQLNPSRISPDNRKTLHRNEISGLRRASLEILASLTSTCRRHDIDPQLYLTQVPINLPTTRVSEISAWLPEQWK